MSGYGPRVNGNVARRLALVGRGVGGAVERLHLDAGVEHAPVGSRRHPRSYAERAGVEPGAGR